MRAIERVGSQSGKTSQPVVIADCGQLSWCVHLQRCCRQLLTRAVALIFAECERQRGFRSLRVVAAAICAHAAVVTRRAVLYTAVRETSLRPCQRRGTCIGFAVLPSSNLELNVALLAHPTRSGTASP